MATIPVSLIYVSYDNNLHRFHVSYLTIFVTSYVVIVTALTRVK